jgi:hypothetical protein
MNSRVTITVHDDELFLLVQDIFAHIWLHGRIMIVQTILLSLLLMAGCVGVSASKTAAVKRQPLVDSTFPVYRVRRLEGSISIDGNWNKRAWKKVKLVRITHDIINIPKFHPETEVKMCYDTGSLYIIFLVHDRYVRSVATKLGGPVLTWRSIVAVLRYWNIIPSGPTRTISG